MSGVDMLLSDSQVGHQPTGPNRLWTIWVPAFSPVNGSEVRDLMERIYQHYCRKLEEKAGLRRKMLRKEEAVSYGSW